MTLKTNIIDFSKYFEHSLLIGDYNAKTSDLNDFLIPDENLLEILDIADDDELLKEFYDYENLLRCGIPLLRYTQDKSRPNKFGRRLLELCQNCSLYIANSRICKDKGIDKCTCKDSTVVDYLLVLSSVFPLISEFEILDFNPLTSDVHNIIHICLNSSRKLENIVIYDEVKPVEDHIKWDARKKDDFLQLVLDDPENKLGEILTKLNLINGPLINSENVCVNDINEVVDKLSKLFTSAAASTFGVKSKYGKNKNNNKPWFTKECNKIRKEFNKARILNKCSGNFKENPDVE
jgi:hypothetical protein